MKKNSLLIFFLASLFIGLTGCEDNATPTTTEYTVTFDAGTGGTLTGAATVKVKSGEKVAKPTDPTRDGFTFVNWQKADGTAFAFDTETITADITLTAGWKSTSPGAVSNVVIELDTAARPTEFRVASYVYTDGDGTVVPNSTAEVKWFASDNSDGTSATEVSTGATYSPVGVNRYKFVSASVRVEAAENSYTPEEKSTTSLFAGFSTKATGSTNKFTASHSAGAVNFNGKMWVIGGYDANKNRINEVWSSSDGATWKQEMLTSSFEGRQDHTVLSFNDTIWVIGGQANGFNNIFDDVWSSTDGVKWTRVAEHAAFPARYGHTSVVFNNKMWVIGGYGSFSVGRLADVWSSSDGVTWAQSTIPSGSGFSARFNHTSVVHDGKMWVIGGDNSAINALSDVWSSSDGATWTQSNIPAGSGFSLRKDHTSVAYDGKMWIIAGTNGSGSKDVWSSSDGTTWKRVLEDAGFPIRSAHTSVLFDDKIFVLGGDGPNQGVLNDVWY